MFQSISQYWARFQRNLFPLLNEEVGPLTDKQLQVATTLEVLRLESFFAHEHGPGRPPEDRVPIARAFVAKAVYNFATTTMLLDRLRCDSALRRICGWERKNAVPSEATFSRAFAEFAAIGLGQRVHETLIMRERGDQLVGHGSSDSTAIEGREKPLKKEPKPKPEKAKKRGRPKKGEERQSDEKKPTRLELQLAGMSLGQMLEDLPKAADVGSKKNSQGYLETWRGYKFHITAGDGEIPLSCILTSASVHDSQAALPLMKMTEGRVQHLYDVMDAAYDAKDIRLYSLMAGRVPLIDSNTRRGQKIGFAPHEARRYKVRTTVERVNARLKDEFGGRTVRVRGHAKVLNHLMFGILALTVDQLVRLAC